MYIYYCYLGYCKNVSHPFCDKKTAGSRVLSHPALPYASAGMHEHTCVMESQPSPTAEELGCIEDATKWKMATRISPGIIEIGTSMLRCVSIQEVEGDPLDYVI